MKLVLNKPVKRMALSPTERDLLNTASYTTPTIGMELSFMAGHDYNGHTKGLLSSLVKQGLLVKVKGGYLRNPTF